MASSPLPFPFPPTTTSYRAGAIFKFEMCQSAPRHPVSPIKYLITARNKNRYFYYLKLNCRQSFGLQIFHVQRGWAGQLSRCSDSLRAGGSGDRIPVGARYFAPVQTGPGTHPASYTLGTGYFPGVKRPGRDVDHQPPSSAEVKERVELHRYAPSGPSWSVIG